MTRRKLACAAAPLLALACSGRGETHIDLSYGFGDIAEARATLPTEDQLLAPLPSETAAPEGEEPALLARQGAAFATKVNRAAHQVRDLLDAALVASPSGHSPEHRELTWGPETEPGGSGQLTLRMRQQVGSEHAYYYELVRTASDAPGESARVIWGLSRPDFDDPTLSEGLLVWDLEANADFERARGRAPDRSDGTGRFAVAYRARSEAGRLLTTNYASLRGFSLPGSAASDAAPVDVDHLYGRIDDGSGPILDFMNSEVDEDFCGTAATSCFADADVASDREHFSFGVFYVDRALGRAEVLLDGGDLISPVRMTECWSPSLRTTSYRVQAGGMMTEMVATPSCQGIAIQSATELGLPIMTDVEPLLAERVGCAAEHGNTACYDLPL